MKFSKASKAYQVCKYSGFCLLLKFKFSNEEYVAYRSNIFGNDGINSFRRFEKYILRLLDWHDISLNVLDA